MRRTLLSLIACAAICASASPVAAMSRLAVYVDHSAKLQVGGDVGSVIVGDPAVADVLVVDRHTIFVQGKGYGQTEVVVLNTDGRTVWQGDVAVLAPDQGRVSLVRGGAASGQSSGPQVTDMTCAGFCAPSAHGGSGGKSTTANPTPSLGLAH